MKDFTLLLDQLKSLYDAELYEDVKILSDLLVGQIESSSSAFSLSEAGTSSNAVCDSKDKYTIYYLYGNAAFNLKEFKLAEGLFNKALQVNKSNLRPKMKTLNQVDCETDITIKFNLNACLVNDKKYQEAFTIVSKIPHNHNDSIALIDIFIFIINSLIVYHPNRGVQKFYLHWQNCARSLCITKKLFQFTKNF